jgi:hypothetical protein
MSLTLLGMEAPSAAPLRQAELFTHRRRAIIGIANLVVKDVENDRSSLEVGVARALIREHSHPTAPRCDVRPLDADVRLAAYHERLRYAHFFEGDIDHPSLTAGLQLGHDALYLGVVLSQAMDLADTPAAVLTAFEQAVTIDLPDALATPAAA